MKSNKSKGHTYSCMETCGQEKPCGNKYCNAHPKYIPPTPKRKKNLRRELPFTYGGR